MIKLMALFCLFSVTDCLTKFDKCASIRDAHTREECRANSSKWDR